MKSRLWITILAIAGMLFSGYYATQFFMGICGGGCAPVFGIPSCMYGFLLFTLILFFSLVPHKWGKKGLLWTAIAGMAFSLIVGIKEMLICVFCYQLGLPNCVYGFVMFCVIAWLATKI